MEPQTPGGDRASAAALVADGALTIRQAAAFAGVSVTMLYHMMARGQLEWIKLGRRRLVPRRALTEFLAARLRGGWAKPAVPAGGAETALLMRRSPNPIT